MPLSDESVREEVKSLLRKILRNEEEHSVLQKRLDEVRAECRHPFDTKRADPVHEICYHYCPSCKRSMHHATLCS